MGYQKGGGAEADLVERVEERSWKTSRCSHGGSRSLREGDHLPARPHPNAQARRSSDSRGCRVPGVPR